MSDRVAVSLPVKRPCILFACIRTFCHAFPLLHSAKELQILTVSNATQATGMSDLVSGRLEFGFYLDFGLWEFGVSLSIFCVHRPLRARPTVAAAPVAAVIRIILVASDARPTGDDPGEFTAGNQESRKRRARCAHPAESNSNQRCLHALRRHSL